MKPRKLIRDPFTNDGIIKGLLSIFDSWHLRGFLSLQSTMPWGDGKGFIEDYAPTLSLKTFVSFTWDVHGTEEKG